MSDVTLIDNFLDDKSFLEIHDKIMNDAFPWFWLGTKPGSGYWSESTVHDNEQQNYQFTHVFYSDNQVRSEYYNVLSPILNKLDCRGVNRIKANLNPFKGDSIRENELHTDNSWTPFTAIYYLNTNDGYTVFEDGTQIESIKNRILIFKTSLKHTGTNCTDQKRRVVINFNYYK